MNDAPTTSLDSYDESILQELAKVYGTLDPMPADLTDRITFNLTLQGLQAEVAQLQQAEPVGARAEESIVGIESMTFTASRVSLMVTVRETSDSDMVRIDGWVTNGGARVELITADGRHDSQTADSNGRLTWTHIPRGVAHFVIRDAGAEPTITPRVEL